MKTISMILLPVALCCSSCRNGKDGMHCAENEKFKKEFFIRINIVEQKLYLHQDSLFQSSLIFLSNYAPVSFYETVNYARIYPPHAFERDKKVWIKWYEENKCNNIQLKDKYPIPEQYQEFYQP
jgi:hypothetical protein